MRAIEKDADIKENRKMKIRERLFVLFLGCAVLIPGPLSSGRQTPPAAAQNPHHDVSVTLKLIQGYVTDK